ncbi:cupin-like domain-containing protein [Calothrix rhizosoleniae]|uniref:cupin-like domain-containing protein n=1 Tax=Calothrix rhizosoleniae TaxID=888997 RepID=UPI001F2ADDF1|nr:cupin-like domain-containing protein [Calothrix rhizosoleniae]
MVTAKLLGIENINTYASYPRTDLLSNIGMKFIWTSRYLKRNENLFKELENSIHERMTKLSPQEYGDVYELPCIYPEEIQEDTLSKVLQSPFPVVIKGVLKDSYAVKNWSLDFFKNNYGNANILCLKQSNNEEKYGTTEYQPHYQVHTSSWHTVDELVNSIRAGERRYAIGSAAIFGSHNKIIEEANLKGIEELFHCQVMRPELIIAGLNTSSFFHCAIAGNIFCLLHGEKRWNFVAPWHSPWMYANVGHSRSHGYLASPIISKEQEKDPSRYPLYKYVPKYTVRLSAGDILFNPPWWWHEVVNFSESIGMPLRVTFGLGGIQPTNILFNLFAAFGSYKVIPTTIINFLRKKIDVDDSKVVNAIHSKLD